MALAEAGQQTGPDIQAAYMAMTRQKRLMSGIILAVFIVLMVGGFLVAQERNAGDFLPGLPKVLEFPAGVVSEAWENRAQLPGFIAQYTPTLIETVNIAAVSTLIGGLAAIFLSLFATRGLAKYPRLVPVVRRTMDLLRAFPEIVIALVLIFILGGGPIPAMIAIALHTAGALGKLFSEINENASLGPIEGLESVGANWSQRMLLGVIPQVAPNYLSYALLRFEINIRASAILGFVGAGGIGYDLRNTITFGMGKFDEAASIFILLFVTIVVVDQLSSRVRDRLTYGKPST